MQSSTGAQHIVARDYGFPSCPKLKERVELVTLAPAEQLVAAVRDSNAQRVARVLEEHPELKAHVNRPLASIGDPPLLAAVQRSDRKSIDVLLRAGADINVRGRFCAGGRGQLLVQHSPEDVKLSQACQLSGEILFRATLASRPNMVATLSHEERRQIADAAQSNNTKSVRLMLAAGWPVDARSEYEMTPLQWASWHGNAEMVREVLRYHPQLELSCEHSITALGCALHGSMNGWHRDTGDYVATVEALLNAGAKAPRVTEHLEASEPVRELLNQYVQ